ncbi:hypothetical protein PZR46_06395, partial [Aliarcobacter butzleri]
MKKLLLIFIMVVILPLNIFAFTQTNFEIALKDFENNNMEKYKDDGLILMSKESLVKNGIVSNENDLIRDVDASKGLDKASIKKYLSCSFVNEDYTATIYDFNPINGIVT